MQACKQSEVACLRERIAQEWQAANRALTAFSPTARHAFISQRYARIWQHHQALTQLVGEQEAMTITCTICEQVDEG